MMDVFLIADCSGSFSDLGKLDLQKLLLHTVCDRSDVEELSDFTIRTYFWRDTVSEHRDGDKLVARGDAGLRVLVDFIAGLPDQTRILLMSDGIFNEDALELKRTIKRKRDLLLTVAVGADADLEVLRLISSGSRVFLPAQIVTAIKVLCFAETAS